LGVDAQIAEYKKKLENTDLKESEKYQFTNTLNKLLEQKIIADKEKRLAEEAAAAEEKARKKREAELAAQAKKAEEDRKAAEAKAKAEAEAKAKAAREAEKKA
jgi:hypothetical protein